LDYGLVGVVLNLGGISRLPIIMPALTGIADRWINAEKLYGILHILSGFAIFLYRKLMTLFFYCFFL
jgi:NHS family xanthosine MFS transporter